MALETPTTAAIGPSAAEARSTPLSDLTGAQVMEFAENNRGVDAQLDTILESTVPVGRKLPQVRRRLREMNINAVTADNRIPSQVGQPILRPDATVDEDGRVTRTTREDVVEATDPAKQPRMSRRTDTQQGQELRQEVGPIVNSALLEALGMRGGEASMRQTETTPVDTDSPALLSAPAAFNTERYQGAITYLTARLDELAGRGQQGRKLAESIRTQVMDDRSMNANDIVGAFMAADAITDTLGGEGPAGGVDVNFHRVFTGGGEYTKNGFKSYQNNIGGRNRAVMDLAFYHDDPVQVAQTAAHEAFHFLQDFYALESPTDAKLLASTYKTKDGLVNYKALPGSIKRLWKRHGVIRGADGLNAHTEALKGKKGRLAGVMASPSEFQAMTYEFYRRAQLAGEKNPLTGAFGRYFDFVGRFLPSLRNKLSGMGYQTPEDIFGRAGRGETATQLDGKELQDRNFAAISKALETQGAEESIRVGAERFLPDVDVTESEPSIVRSEIPITRTITRNKKSFLDVFAKDDDEADYEFRSFFEDLLNADYPELYDPTSDVPFPKTSPFEAIELPDGVQMNSDMLLGGEGPLGAGPRVRTLQDIIAAVRNRVQGSNAQKADILETAMSNFYRVFELYEPGGQNRVKFLSLESEETDIGEKPSVTIAIYPDGTISDPYVDSETINAYRLENEMFDFFPEVGEKTAKPEVSKVLAYASLKDDFDVGVRFPDKSEADQPEMADMQVWDLGFSVGGNFITTNETDKKGALETFAKAVASYRAILNDIKDKGYEIDAVVFSGTDGKKHLLYDKMLNNKSIMSLFPELDAGSVEPVRYSGARSQGTFVRLVDDGQEGPAGESSLRMDRVADLSQVPANPANDGIASAFGLNPMMRALSALDMLYNPEYRPEIPDRDTTEGPDGTQRAQGRNVGEIGLSLQNKARALIGTITSPNPETDEMLARIIAAETAAAMRNNPDTNASDWYSKNVQAAIDAVAQLYPEVATDSRHRSAFALSLALTSQGIRVSRNSDIGLAAYEFWRQNGRFPVFGEGTASRAMRSNFRLANRLMKIFDKDGSNFRFEDFLSTQYTKKELVDVLNDAGIPVGAGGVTLTGENMAASLYGSAVFGPKIGQGFYQNLMGNFDPITIDMWFMRTWGRLTGVLVGKPKLQENINNLATEMRKEGIEFDPELYGSDQQYTFNTISRVFNMGERFYAENRDAIEAGEAEKSPAMREAARAVTNGLTTIDSPTSGAQREWIRSVIRRAREVLAENGINVTSADLQAIIWYPEKDLYSLLREGGQEARLNQSYEDVYEELINGETGLRSVDGGSRFNTVRQAVREADRKAGTSTRAASGQEASIRFSTGDYRTTEGMRRNLANPETQGVLNSVSNFVWRARNEEGFLTGQYRKFINEFVHGLAPIARRELELAQRTTGERRYLPFAQGAFKITEVAQQMSGRMEMFSRVGAPKLNRDGSVGIAENTMGLKQIFEPIGTGERYAKFQMYVYAQRAQRLKREGREKLMSDADIAEGLRYGRENPEFDAVFRNYTRFNEALMKFLQDSGAITSEQRQKLIGTADYVPFYRIIDEEQYTEGLFGQVRRGNEYARNSTSAFDNPDARIRDVLQKLQGGEERIGDLYENVFSNTQAIVHAAMRNVATQRVVNVVEQLKRTGFYGENKKPKRISKEEAQQNNNHFTYRENGKTVFYDVGTDGELITAMRTFTPTQLQGLLRTMQNIGRFFRNAITITPSFMIANLIRGDMAGVVTTDAPLRPMVDTIRGLKNALQDTETIQEMKTIGGFGGYTFGESSTDFAKKMKRFYRRHEGYTIVDTPQKLTDMFSGLVDRINYVGEATELATREAIYRRLVEGGVDKADAAYEALNLINYSRRGNPQGGLAQTFALLVPLVPFLNARVQGLYRTGTAFGTEATARKTAVKGLALMGMSLGLYSIMSQQDDWDKEPLHRKLNYYIIYAGDKKFLIPKPFEVGAIFSTIPEVFIDGIRNKDGEYVAEAVSQIFLNNFSFNPIPQAISPILEVATNRDFFRGRELESLGVRGLPTEMRAYSTTSEFAKLVGQGSAAMGISPIEFEQLVNGYLGSLGGLFLGGMDSVLGTFGTVPERPAGLFGNSVADTAARNLGISRFVKERPADPSNRYLSEFYEMKREADELLRGINRLREEGNIEEARALKRANRGLLAVRTTLNKKYSTLNSINDKIAGIKTSGMEPEEKKKRIDTLIRQRNRIVSDMARLKERIRGSK